MIRAALTATLALALAAGAVFGLAPRLGSQERPPLAQVGLVDLAWLAGTWKGVMFEQQAEETWSAPAAGGMMGMFRLLGEERASVYEFLLLEQDASGLHLRFNHFGPGHKIWEKTGPLEFKLASAEGSVFVFESPNPAQSPSRITYARPDPEKLIVIVETLREGQATESFDVVYSRAP